MNNKEINNFISVIMSVCNDENNLNNSINSILNQTYENFEFLILDDGSTDKTNKILKKFAEKDQRIKIFKNKNVQGLSKSLNFLIENAKGNFLARMDSDDFSYKERLEVQIDYMNKNENIDEMLDKYCPNGVNVYFDNVGGRITDSVINKLANYARVAVCGVISQYNLTAPEPGLRTHRAMLTNQATTEGFLVFQFAQKYHIGLERMAKWIKEGKIIYKEDVVEGLEKAPEAFIGLMNGKNFGMIFKRN